MTAPHSAFQRRASVFACSILLGVAGLFAACSSSPSTVGISAGAGGSGAASGGAASSGAGSGGKAVGGSGAAEPCGGKVCASDQRCCGPAECGRCIPATSGQACLAQCPGGGGGGGANANGGTGAQAGAGGVQAGAGGVQAGAGGAQGGAGGAQGCAKYGQSCTDRACCVGLVCAGGCVMMPGATGGSSGSGGSGGASSTGGTSSGVNCSPTKPSAFPTFDRSCSSLNDCSAVVHRVDCCGTVVITGIKSSELTRFNAAEQTCDSQYPACGCHNSPTMTDSGQTPTSTSAPVECLMGTCTTYVP